VDTWTMSTPGQKVLSNKDHHLRVKQAKKTNLFRAWLSSGLDNVQVSTPNQRSKESDQ
jgi:hypothetical protein